MSEANESGNRPLVRNADELAVVGAMLLPFHKAGYSLFPLRMSAKIPRDAGWQTNKYADKDLGRWVKAGGNLGIRLTGDDLVLDIDPRHQGLESLARLQSNLGIDFAAVPAVLSGRGDGGKHLYLKKPAGLPVRKALEGYPGIDVKSDRSLVVAPGSRHPVTGGLYRVDPDARPIDQVGPAPQVLLDALGRRAVTSRVKVGGGELSVEQVAVLLGALDPREYGAGHYDRWFRLAAACHDATDGDGLEEFLVWAARDPEYGSEVDEERIGAMWASLKAGKAGGVSYLHLLGEVARTGRLDLVLAVEPTYVVPSHCEPRALDFAAGPPRLSSSMFNTKGGAS